MDSFELNKILGAILGTCLILLATSFAAGAIFAPVTPAKPGYVIAVKEAAEGGAIRADRETAADRLGGKG
jgi:cytochrome c